MTSEQLNCVTLAPLRVLTPLPVIEPQRGMLRSPLQLNWNSLSTTMFSSQGRAPSDLKEIEEAIERRDGPLLTRKLDQKCRLIRSYGLQRWDKVDITKLKKFNLKEDLPPQLEPLWAELSGAQGGFELEQWTYEVLRMDHGLQPPRKFTETMSHEFSLRDADSATLEAMLAINAPDEDLDDARAYADTARHETFSYERTCHSGRGIGVGHPEHIRA